MIFVLIGMPACGKSCMARAISKKLGMKNVDSDRLIEKKCGKKLCEIIEEDGLDGFMKIEQEVLLSISDDNIILATGGSAVYYPEAMEHLKQLGKIVYLYCSYEVVKARLGDFSTRGVVLREGQTLRELYNERKLLYQKYADIIVDCSGRDYSAYQRRVITAIRSILENM